MSLWITYSRVVTRVLGYKTIPKRVGAYAIKAHDSRHDNWKMTEQVWFAWKCWNEKKEEASSVQNEHYGMTDTIIKIKGQLFGENLTHDIGTNTSYSLSSTVMEGEIICSCFAAVGPGHLVVSHEPLCILEHSRANVRPSVPQLKLGGNWVMPTGQLSRAIIIICTLANLHHNGQKNKRIKVLEWSKSVLQTSWDAMAGP